MVFLHRRNIGEHTLVGISPESSDARTEFTLSGNVTLPELLRLLGKFLFCEGCSESQAEESKQSKDFLHDNWILLFV